MSANPTKTMMVLRSGLSCGVLLAALGVCAAPAWGQAAGRAVFVANNGNLEGSVTAFAVNGDGTLTFHNRVITGTRPTTNDPCPGCNPYEISLSPSGHYLATCHGSGPDNNEQVTIFSVAADGTIAEIYHQSFLVGAGMDIQWMSDDLVAVTRTDLSPNQVLMLHWNPAGPSLAQVDSKPVGGAGYYLGRHPALPVLYSTSTSTSAGVRAFQVASSGTMTQIDFQSTSQYALDFALTHDGTKLYAGGGITYVIQGFAIDVDGTISGPLAGSPFPQFGTSPSNIAVSPHDRFLLVGHGTDATVRTAAIDPATGGLTYTGAMFDLGTQGSIGDVQALDNLFFVSDVWSVDGHMGVFSFTLHPDGSFTQNGTGVFVTQGIGPRAIATWSPHTPALCLGDGNCDGHTNFADIDYFVAAIPDAEAGWAALYAARHGGALPPCQFANNDINADGHVNFADIDPFVALIPSECP